jgi:hypothetical protein
MFAPDGGAWSTTSVISLSPAILVSQGTYIVCSGMVCDQEETGRELDGDDAVYDISS